MTVLPLQPEYPNEASDLSKWMGPRREQEPGALERLRPQDAEGVGASYSRHHRNAENNRRVAHLIGELWGVSYPAAGPGVQATMRQAARQVIIECDGDVEAVEGLVEKMKADPKWAGPCKNCQSAYSIAGRIKAYRAVQLSQNAPVDYLDGRTVEEIQEEQADNAITRAERLARRKAIDEEAKTRKAEREAMILARWQARWGKD